MKGTICIPALQTRWRAVATPVLCIGLMVGSWHRAVAAPTLAPGSAPGQDQRQAVTVGIRDPHGLALGSGIVLMAGSGGDWVVTNRHVLQSLAAVCVDTVDQHSLPGQAHPGPPGWRDLDLALVWLPRASAQPPRPVASVMAMEAAGDLSPVTATGYPVGNQTNAATLPYLEVGGLLVPLLQSPLREGFDLTYTAAVQKGMSGGGIFVGNQLIGLNGAHPDPLWKGEWQGPDSTGVGERLNRQLELVALGLSSRYLLPLLDAQPGLTPPAPLPEPPPTCAPAPAQTF